MKDVSELLESFSKLPVIVQLVSVLGFFTLLILIAANPAAGVAISGFLLALGSNIRRNNIPKAISHHRSHRRNRAPVGRMKKG